MSGYGEATHPKFPDFSNVLHLNMIKTLYGQLNTSDIAHFKKQLQSFFHPDGNVVQERRVIYALLSLNATAPVKDPDVEEWRRRLRLQPHLVGPLFDEIFSRPVVAKPVANPKAAAFNPIEIVHYLSEKVEQPRHSYSDDSTGQVEQALALVELYDKCIKTLTQARDELYNRLHGLPQDPSVQKTMDRALAALNPQDKQQK